MSKQKYVRSGVKRLNYWPRLGIQITAGIGIAYLMILYHDLTFENSIETYLMIAVIFAALLVAPKFSQNNEKRELYAIFIAHVAWISAYVLILPADTPFLVMNYLLIYLSALQLDKQYVYMSALSLVIATELAALTSDPLTTEIIVRSLVVSTTIIIIGILSGEVISQKVEQEKIVDDKVKEATLAKERLQSLINSMADGVIATDSNGRVVVYNGAALEILNVNVSLENRPLNDYLKVKDKEDKKINLFEMSQKSRAYLSSRDYHIELEDGERVSLYLSIAQVRIGYGKQGEQGYILLMRDITSEKSLEEERDEFISVVSHELRTPITIAEGNISNAQLVTDKDEVNMDAVKDSLTEAHVQVVFLSEMINDLSTLSRAERGKLQYAPEKINVPSLMHSLHVDYEIEANQKGLDLLLDLDKHADAVITSRLYLREILQNFITNSIKYTQNGSITLISEKSSDGIIISVKDTGIGISKSDQKKLFNKFFRSEDYRTRENNGTGLGLYVTQKLANLIEAKIEIESVLDKGSTFRIHIPNLKLPKKRTKVS